LATRYSRPVLTTLSHEDRMLLLKFVCAFAWADLELHESERRFVERLMRRFKLEEAERAQVDQWLQVAPAPSEVDPALVPREHRRAFIEATRAVIYADGRIDDDERTQFERLREALA
jgi:uncharacterized tellurite resistance protein B-like protein